MSEVKFKKLLVLLTNEDTRRLIDIIDPYSFDPMRFVFAPKDEGVNMHLPRELHAVVKPQAKLYGPSYQRDIPEALERSVRDTPIPSRYTNIP